MNWLAILLEFAVRPVVGYIAWIHKGFTAQTIEFARLQERHMAHERIDAETHRRVETSLEEIRTEVGLARTESLEQYRALKTESTARTKQLHDKIEYIRAALHDESTRHTTELHAKIDRVRIMLAETIGQNQRRES